MSLTLFYAEYMSELPNQVCALLWHTVKWVLSNSSNGKNQPSIPIGMANLAEEGANLAADRPVL